VGTPDPSFQAVRNPPRLEPSARGARFDVGCEEPKGRRRPRPVSRRFRWDAVGPTA